MNPRFKPVALTRHFNSPAALSSRDGWHAAMDGVSGKLPREKSTHWGIPFQFGPEDVQQKGSIVLRDGEEITVRLNATATHVCVAHFCDLIPEYHANAGGGEEVATYVLRYADGQEHAQVIRRRFETNLFSVGWGNEAFAAVNAAMPAVPNYEQALAPTWGWLQTGVSSVGGSPVSFWVYALENPRPERPIRSVTFRATSPVRIAILGLTLYTGPGHPLRHVPRRVYKLTLPASEKALPSEVKAELDLGIITRFHAVPGHIDAAWVRAVDRGLGSGWPTPTPTREFLVEATGSEGATLKVQTPAASHELPFGDAWTKGVAKSDDGKARIQLLHPRTTWVHVTVTDVATGQETPTRAHFCGANGEYLPPYGHHAVVNDRWFEDYGGDLQLGGSSYAYVPGRFQIELPVGEVYVELAKGFEYEPLRRKLQIRSGQRELRLSLRRGTDWRNKGWVTADTHVHFISPETAWLEGQGEGINLINLLASQWGRLYTNAADITGALSGCSRDDTLVWVGTENRHHLLGHISMLGTHGDPVFPMCDGGPGEAYIGDPDYQLLTEWAETCKQREGVVIRPHFPFPVCEEPLYFLTGNLDGAELRQFADPESGSLDQFHFTEWYRYLNCGCRVAAVGGTDKMSAGMPVGGVRTYAQLDPGDEFSFENWGKAVRAGRTFTTSGPLIDLRVDGRAMGDEIRLKPGGGTLEVEATATSLWPIHRLEIVLNGAVVAATYTQKDTRTLSLREAIPVSGSGWIAARCGSRLRVNHCWPIHLGAHTSPVYIVVGDEQVFSPSDASYMLTLIDGGLTYLETLSVRYDEKRHREMKARFGKVRRQLAARMRAAK